MSVAMESMFGYITVLPGAFSAYRWEALQGDPLKQYFHHLFTPLKKTRPFESNMYLAEDRILCYELVSKRGHHYRLKYVKEAVGRTDVPTKLVDLLKQRRRWLNGSLFALVYALLGWSRLMLNSKHSVWRKILFTIEYMYFALLLVFQWFAVSNLYLTFYYIMKYGSEPLSSIFPYVRYAFLGVLLIQFVLGLGNKPHRVSRLYVFSSAFFGVFAYAILGLTVYQVVLSDFDKRVTLYATITFGLIFAVSFLYGEILSVSSSFLQYLFFVPTYIIIFPVYSLCNVHDISWGTKNSNPFSPFPLLPKSSHLQIFNSRRGGVLPQDRAPRSPRPGLGENACPSPPNAARSRRQRRPPRASPSSLRGLPLPSASPLDALQRPVRLGSHRPLGPFGPPSPRPLPLHHPRLRPRLHRPPLPRRRPLPTR